MAIIQAPTLINRNKLSWTDVSKLSWWLTEWQRKYWGRIPQVLQRWRITEELQIPLRYNPWNSGRKIRL